MRACPFALLAASLVLAGCTNQVATLDSDLQLRMARTDHLGLTAEYVFTDEQFDNREFEEKVSSGLNRWIGTPASLATPVVWSVDPLVSSLPAESQASGLDGKTFWTLDAHYIQGQMWLKRLSEEVARRPLSRTFWPPWTAEMEAAAPSTTELSPGRSEPFTTALGRHHPQLSAADAGQLALACKYFDWTIRNVQLLELTPWPDAETVAQRRVIESESDWPPACGVAGPGYQRFVWQVVLFGRGDAWDRGRVFAQLAHQVGIDVVMLALDGGSVPTGTRFTPWCCGALIGRELFLFDPRLGLPLLAPDGSGLATLNDLRQNPEHLRSFDLTIDESTSDDSTYWVRPEQLSSGQLVALIDAPVESLSYRMAALERHLTGDERLSLTHRPSDLARRLNEAGYDFPAVLWPVEWWAAQYRQALEEGLKQARYNADTRDKLAWISDEEDYVSGYVRFRTAKNKYFRNRLESPRGIRDRGAIEMFSVMRYSDELIDSLHQRDNILQALGINQLGITAIEFTNRVNNVKQQMRLVRGDATYFLALCHLENGNPSIALSWFDRVSEFDERGHWEGGVRYLQGRAAEMLGQTDEAITRYRQGQHEPRLAPQTHGNLLRARLLAAPASAPVRDDALEPKVARMTPRGASF